MVGDRPPQGGATTTGWVQSGELQRGWQVVTVAGWLARLRVEGRAGWSVGGHSWVQWGPNSGRA